MHRKTFKLFATVSGENLDAVRAPILRFLGPGARIELVSDGFKVEAVISGESAKELDRQLLSEMRWVAKKARLWAEWTSNGETEMFFDYVPRGAKADGSKGGLPDDSRARAGAF
jgi:hypothetical protein